MLEFGQDIGIDLGTATVIAYVKGKGIVLREPSVVAVDKDTGDVLAVGKEARRMLGRTPGNIVAVRPLRQGVISDYTVTEKMLSYFISRTVGKSLFGRKPRISVCVPSGATEVEKKAVEDATYQAGAREVSIIEEPVAAAIGAGIDIAKPCGNMIVDIGGGTADIAVISLGGVVVSNSIKVAGDDFDEAIVRFMRKKHNLLIGERTAEEIKINVGTVYKRPENLTMDVRGRNLVTGLPKTVTVTSEETEEALISSGGDKEYASLPEQHRFVIPDGCHWQEVRERTENLGAAIVGAMRQIEIANPDTLYGVLSMFSSQKWTNKAILNDSKIRDLIEHLSKRKLGNKDYPADLMGDAYEILLKKFADDSKAQAGEFYTPRSVVRLLVHILDPQPGETVYDPACGSGGMLIEAIRYMHDDSLCCGSIFGQEKNVVNAAIAKMNLFLHGASDFNVMQGDTLRDPKILQGGNIAKFDCVIANPPFSLENWGATEWSSDKYKRNIYGTPSDSCGDYAWIQHMIYHLKFYMI